jgi:hypothetical protein
MPGRISQILTPFSDLGLNVWAGTCVAFFLPAKTRPFRLSFTQVLLLLLVSFCLPFFYDYYKSAPANYFNIYGLNYQASLYLLFFFSVSLVAHIQRDFSSLLKMIIMFLAIVPAVFIVNICLLYVSGIQNLIEPALATFVIFIIWYFTIVFRLIGYIYQIHLSRSLLLTLLYIVINVAPLFWIPNQPLWHGYLSPDRETDGKVTLNVEDTFYAQMKMLESSGMKLLHQRPGIIDIYFLGFAGDANEDVFMNEARRARLLFDERFDTRGRSMLLVNNIKTVQIHPLANSNNLDLALNEIAARMDTGEDILFLFMTSHGSEDHKLSVSFAPMLLNDITPERIQSGLENAGIKWRVIILSACYSGAFINYLKDDYTLIITAASEDRNSFGCGHDGNFTYFGEAYFGKYLRQEYSFISAFNLAKEEIKRREEREERTPSQPQVFIGKEIEQKLSILVDRLEKEGRNNWAMSK